jgi:hypothetical protein
MFRFNNFFDPAKTEINNILPTFKNCTFSYGSITHDRGDGPLRKYKTQPDSKYYMKTYSLFDLDKLSTDKHLMIKPDGSLMTTLEEKVYPAEIVFEDCKFIKTGLNSTSLNMPGNRNIMFINCTFDGNKFYQEKFLSYHFYKCSFNNVSFRECTFAYSYFKECTFKATLFISVVFTKGGAIRFTKCKLLDCKFLRVTFNQIGYDFRNPGITIGSGFINNRIANNFGPNTAIGTNFSSNVIFDNFQNNTIDDDFTNNNIKVKCDNVLPASWVAQPKVYTTSYCEVINGFDAGGVAQTQSYLGWFDTSLGQFQYTGL